MDSGEAVTSRATLVITGVVQGVGFRPYIANLARAHGLTGQVRNEGGRVRIMAYGSAAQLRRFAEAIAPGAPAASRIQGLKQHMEPLPACETPPSTFTIEPSGRAAGALLPTPDIALCDDCLREMDTPGDPRYQNPFISCAHCGPRFTILSRLPYDRQNTAMSGFPYAACANRSTAIGPTAATMRRRCAATNAARSSSGRDKARQRRQSAAMR